MEGLEDWWKAGSWKLEAGRQGEKKRNKKGKEQGEKSKEQGTRARSKEQGARSKEQARIWEQETRARKEKGERRKNERTRSKEKGKEQGVRSKEQGARNATPNWVRTGSNTKERKEKKAVYGLNRAVALFVRTHCYTALQLRRSRVINLIVVESSGVELGS